MMRLCDYHPFPSPLDIALPQIMSENDLEQRAFAEFTLARCIIAAGDSSRTFIQLALTLSVRRAQC